MMVLEAYVIPGVAIVLLLFLLSNVKWLQDIGLRLGQMRFRLGRIEMTINILFFSLISLRLVTEIFNIQRYKHKLDEINDSAAMSRSMQDRLKGGTWRAERNFWICLFGVILWLFVIRISRLLNYFKDKLHRTQCDLENVIFSTQSGTQSRESIAGGHKNKRGSGSVQEVELTQRFPSVSGKVVLPD